MYDGLVQAEAEQCETKHVRQLLDFLHFHVVGVLDLCRMEWISRLEFTCNLSELRRISLTKTSKDGRRGQQQQLACKPAAAAVHAVVVDFTAPAQQLARQHERDQVAQDADVEQPQAIAHAQQPSQRHLGHCWPPAAPPSSPQRPPCLSATRIVLRHPP